MYISDLHYPASTKAYQRPSYIFIYTYNIYIFNEYSVGSHAYEMSASMCSRNGPVLQPFILDGMINISVFMPDYFHSLSLWHTHTHRKRDTSRFIWGEPSHEEIWEDDPRCIK